jgi:methionyl-tRNA synthetase
MKKKIDYSKFLEIEQGLEITLGTIQSVEKMPNSDKMLKLSVFFGENDQRTVMTNIGNRLDNINDLMFITLPFVTNLEPAKIMGVMSEAMIMVPTVGDKINLSAVPGSKLI